MHEMSIAHGLVESVTDAAAARGAFRVTRVAVRIGRVSGVVPEALAFAWDVATAGTAAAGATLEIEPVPLTLRCGDCGEITLDDTLPRFVCPRCGDPAVVVRGRELELTLMEIDDEPAPAGSAA